MVAKKHRKQDSYNRELKTRPFSCEYLIMMFKILYYSLQL